MQRSGCQPVASFDNDLSYIRQRGSRKRRGARRQFLFGRFRKIDIRITDNLTNFRAKSWKGSRVHFIRISIRARFPIGRI